MNSPSPKNDIEISKSNCPTPDRPLETIETIGAKPSANTLVLSICDFIEKNRENKSLSSGNENFNLNSGDSPRMQSQLDSEVIVQATKAFESIHSASPQDLPALLKGLLLPQQDLDKTFDTLSYQIRNKLGSSETQTLSQPGKTSSGTIHEVTANQQEAMALAALVAFTQSGFDAGQLPPSHRDTILMGRSVGEWLSLFKTFWASKDLSQSGLRSGQKMVGRFKLVRLLGKGAFGEVHEAIDTSLGRTVAVKLPVSKNRGPQDWEYIRREAQLAAAIDHPNVVPLLEIGEHNGNPFLVSALIHGLSMKDWLADGSGTIPPKKAATWVAMAARGVQAIHDRGILHCDLKTGNIMLDEASTGKTGVATPRIMDFGLSGWNGEQGTDREDGPMGTPATMAPEQLCGRAALTVRTDVYALGAILHELLFGENHHQATSIQAIFTRLESNAAPLPGPRPIPKDLDAIRIKCLAPLPEDRYHSAEELSRDLELFLDGRAPAAVRATAIGQFKRLFLRRPALVGSAMAASITVALMASAGIVMAIQLELAKGAKREAELRASLEASKKDFLEQRQCLSEARVLLDSPKPGSVAQSLATLSRLLAANPDSSTALEARSLALQAGLLPRIEALPQWGGSIRYYLSAWSPKADWVALSDPKGKLFLSSEIHFADEKNMSVRESLAVPPNLAFQAASGRQDGARSMAIAPSGQWLAVGTRGGFVHVYNLTKIKKNPEYSLDCKTSEIGNLFFSDEGRSITCLSQDKVLISIQSKSGKYSIASRHPLAPLPVISITVSLQARKIFLAMNDATVQVRSLDDPGTIVAQGGNLGTAVFYLDNGTILRRHHNRLDICDIRISNILGTQATLDLKPITPVGSSKFWGSEFPPISACATHPSGSYVALLTSTGTIQLVEVLSGRVVCSWHEEGEIVSVTFSPDGKRLAVTGGSGARMYGFELPLIANPVGTGKFEPEFAWYSDNHPDPEVILSPRLENDPLRTLVKIEGASARKIQSGIEYLNESQSMIKFQENQGEIYFIPIKDRDLSKAPASIPGVALPENVTCSSIINPMGQDRLIRIIGTNKGILEWDSVNSKVTAEWINVSGMGIGRAGTNYLQMVNKWIMALGVDGTARLFDSHLHLLKSWRIGKAALTHSCALPSNDGDFCLVLIGDEEGGISLVDLDKDQPLLSIKAHEGRVRKIATVQHRDGLIILTAGLDGRIKAWKHGKSQLAPLGSIEIGKDAHILETDGQSFVIAARGQTGVWKGKIEDLIQLLSPSKHD